MKRLNHDNVKYIVLHYTATYDDMDIGVREIRQMHLNRGFSDVGYHYVIRLDGTVEKGRSTEYQGAHEPLANASSIAIATIGGCRRATGPDVGIDTRTPKQKQAQLQLIRNLLVKYPNAKVVGHKDFKPTQCPGYDAASWLASASGIQLPVSDVPSPYTKPQNSTAAPKNSKSTSPSNSNTSNSGGFFNWLKRLIRGDFR